MSQVPNKGPLVVSAAGAITPGNYNHLNSGSALALTLAAPTVDGLDAILIDETGKAHTVTTPAGVINGSLHILTFNGTAGSACHLVSRNGIWWVISQIGVTIT